MVRLAGVVHTLNDQKKLSGGSDSGYLFRLPFPLQAQIHLPHPRIEADRRLIQSFPRLPIAPLADPRLPMYRRPRLGLDRIQARQRHNLSPIGIRISAEQGQQREGSDRDYSRNAQQ